ncbi:hypothetical protein AB0L63_10665 [Nocardia sp. NPDC051990]|uniref:hypothetical protein n=1 Tax=Nocardia sp. NPDC051990 TaxID=3155285 RepID=UPI00341DFB83
MSGIDIVDLALAGRAAASPPSTPASGKPMPSNPTVLDRNYLLGLAVALTLVWSLVVIAHTATTRGKCTRRD